ncbi:hypothetical protein [Acidimangrovimonas pyrenivorans]|uniref:Uncharacterized protein n=1 Tax=Acidimangrovimonas pyrenivorans TaxID=2030798 RepID=A0ABV7AD88_9RHOB
MALAPAEMQVVLRTEGRAPEVFIKMAAAPTREFAAFTAAHVGDVVHVTVCGKEITAPVLRGKIPGGTIRLAMPDMNLANTIADQLKGTAPCPATK